MACCQEGSLKATSFPLEVEQSPRRFITGACAGITKEDKLCSESLLVPGLTQQAYSPQECSQPHCTGRTCVFASLSFLLTLSIGNGSRADRAAKLWRRHSTCFPLKLLLDTHEYLKLKKISHMLIRAIIHLPRYLRK